MSDNYPVDGELRRQAARIEALEQAHAELAAKVDELTPNDEGMHTFPEKTAAQERYHEANEHHYSNREVEMAAGAFDRAEEVSQELDDWTHLIHMRLNTMSQRIASLESPTPAPDPVCAKCGHDKCHHIGFGAFCAASHCECGGWYVEPVPTAEPEPAPLDPVLVLTDNEVEMLREIVNARTSGTGGLIMSTQIDYREIAIGMLDRAYGRDGAR